MRAKGWLGFMATLAFTGGVAHAEPIAVWTFETVPPPSVFDTAVYPNPLNPDVGVGIGAGVHLSPASDWTTFVGNGSATAFSSTVWSVNDYYGFQVSTLGYENIEIGWDQTRNAVGPTLFRVVASTDGINFTTIQNYTVLLNDGANGGIWNDNVNQPAYRFGPIALGAAFANKPAVYVRLLSLEASATVTGAVRLDNFGIEGDPLPPILEVLKTDVGANAPVEPGDNFSYEITVSHAAGSNQDAVNVAISDALPNGVGPAGASMELALADGSTVTLTVAADGDDGEIVGGVVTVFVGDLGLLDEVTLTIPVAVVNRTTPGALDNTATVAFEGSIGGLPYSVDSNKLTIGFVACDTNADCPNTNPCVAQVTCQVGVCVPSFNTIACDDGNPCTEQEACASGQCVGGQTAACDDDESCTDDTCNPASGCVFTPDNTNTCSDGNTCTGGDACNAGECLAGDSITPCDDDDVCTDDRCDLVLGCVFTADLSNTCNDSNACTSGDSCASGSCGGTPNSDTCNDGSATTRGDVCTAGACVGTAYTCTPSQCELTSVANGTDCTVTFKPANSECNDANVNTRTDVCDGAGACAGTTYTCTPGVCQASSMPDGVGCVTTPAAVGTSCDDLAGCTASDACDATGACKGTAVECGDGEICDAASGTCAATHCEACAESSECGANSECVPVAGNSRCLVTCATVDDCVADHVCVAHANGTSYCFDAAGDCPAPVPEPEVVEPDPEFLASGGASCQGGGASLALMLAGLLVLGVRRARRA